ncbi:unnamed protein product [Durusdinium trenchii]|uniref:Uncharacterized protein n=1 Tax=Durusdinium trenchii TaxID=1381693 RepID=A0ABP0PI61_9DINO
MWHGGRLQTSHPCYRHRSPPTFRDSPRAVRAPSPPSPAGLARRRTWRMSKPSASTRTPCSMPTKRWLNTFPEATKAGEAAGYREAAVDWDKVNSMTQSLNELLRKSEALDGGDPPEVLMARHLHNQAKALVDEGETPLERFDYLEEKNQEAEQVFDGITLEELHKARDALHDQQDMAEEALKRADLHHDQMEKILHEWNSRSTVTKLPREMTKPNGDPWWPDPVPPPRLPDREIMLVPAGGGIKNFSPPGRYFL